MVADPVELEYSETPEPMWNPALRALPIPGIRRMVNMAAEMDDVIHLSIGQPDFPVPDHVIEAHIDALRYGQTGYTMDAGLPELLETIAEYYADRYQRPITPENVLVTTGATEAIYLALAATAAPGRQFLVPDPSFPLYAPLIRMNGGEVKAIPTRAENGHQLDPQEVIDSIGMRTFGIILNSPSNPTGTVYPRETVEAIVQEAAYRGVYVYSDEVYDHLLLDDLQYASVLNCTSDLDHVMMMSSFSKTYSMSGLRIGWIISSQGAIKKLRRFHIFTTTVANTPAQWAGVAALRGRRAAWIAWWRSTAGAGTGWCSWSAMRPTSPVTGPRAPFTSSRHCRRTPMPPPWPSACCRRPASAWCRGRLRRQLPQFAAHQFLRQHG